MAFIVLMFRENAFFLLHHKYARHRHTFSGRTVNPKEFDRLSSDRISMLYFHFRRTNQQRQDDEMVMINKPS